MRLGDESASCCSTLLLPSRDFIWIPIKRLLNRKLSCKRLDLLVYCTCWYARNRKGKCNIFANRKGIEQIGVLENKTQLFPAESSQFFRRKTNYVPPTNNDMPISGTIYRSQAIQKCGLPRSRGAHNCDKFSLFYREIHMI